ncbi:MAG: MBL fold metallo-hydrolase, partial [Candidatus Poseidoniales archaeon]|nr:MBL fold metallo-hydrolase [Candidatus Poseidoniales archaeon]
LGGGNEVGTVGIVLEDPTSNRLLLDYGIAPTKPPRYPNEAPHVSNAIITHSHIDHLGMVPWLASNHNTTLHGTELTAAISEMMWYDCHKVSSIEGYPLPWDKRDIDLALSAWKTHQFNQPWKQDDWKLELHRAGHIPGAAMLHVETPNKSVLFSGDFDTRDSQLTVGAKPVQTDVLFVEGTYGGRDHPPKQEENQRFIERVVEVIDRGGTALVPAFANGRTQDVVMLLHKHLPELDVHVDGMGKRVAKLQMEHPETLRDPSALESAWKWCRRVSSKSDRKKALDADVIVSTSGMLDGGPSIWYLNRLRHERKNAILLTGYQARNTGGRRLLDERRIPIFGKLANIELDVDQYSFSTHAGHQEIVDFAEQCQAEDVVIYHSDPTMARPPLAEALEKNGHQVHVPENGISGILD